jgi:hypothetical protein
VRERRGDVAAAAAEGWVEVARRKGFDTPDPQIRSLYQVIDIIDLSPK